VAARVGPTRLIDNVRLDDEAFAPVMAVEEAWHGE
jgi:hypothetical protein